jgi:hypothetical protein
MVTRAVTADRHRGLVRDPSGRYLQARVSRRLPQKLVRKAKVCQPVVEEIIGGM